MPVPIVLSGSIAPWPVICAMYAGGAVVVVLLTIAIALLTRDSRSMPRHRGQAGPPAYNAEAPAEHVLV
jgi:hypothetical protein